MIGYLFPGQGTQRVGMYSLLGTKSRETDEVFEAANEAAGKDVKKLCQDASEQELRMTINTQICVTAMNMAYLKILENRGIRPDIVGGHSLGQFSAFAAAEVISLFDLFKIINKRASLASELSVNGKMATVLGLERKVLEEICAECGNEEERVSIALENSNSQIVLGGAESAVDSAINKAKAAGAIKVIEVKVSNAFHTYLMEPMVDELEKYLDKVEFRNPKARILLNFKGDYADDIYEIKRDAVMQCTHEVKWKSCMNHLLKEHEILLAEVGVGKTVSGFIKSMDKNKKTYTLSNNKDFTLFTKLASAKDN